jgi:Arc/MetJ-type ribon-helix-helix transcriptional regulator
MITMIVIMRTIIDIPDDLLDKLQVACTQEGVSRSEYIRSAIRALLKTRTAPTDEAFGLWKAQGTASVDGLKYERKLRKEWSRE